MWKLGFIFGVIHLIVRNAESYVCGTKFKVVKITDQLPHDNLKFITLKSYNGAETLSDLSEESPSNALPETSFKKELSNVKAVRYFINLTNGIEAVSILLKQGVPMEQINYFRLQSTHCEMRNYEGIIENLDYNLLMSLALGYVCVVYDYGSRGNGMEDEREGIPRAYWWGTEWIRYVLDHFWHLEDEGKEVRMVRGYNSRKIFEDQVKLLPKDLKRRIKYFRVYLQTNRIHLYPLYSKTDRDGEREYYSALLVDAAKRESSDDMSREDIDNFVQTRIVSEDMHIYRSTDFEGFGRAEGYGKIKDKTTKLTKDSDNDEAAESTPETDHSSIN